MNKVILAVFLFFIGFFLFFPYFDLEVTSLFWDGKHFYLANNILIKILYYSVNVVTPILIIGILITIGYQYFSKKEFKYASKKNLFYILLVAIIGSGLLVNAVLKNNWGRARPSQTIQFGGNKQFTPPFIPAKECKKNCSFVCGHASVGFLFISLWFLYRRKIFIYGTLLYGSLIGFARIVQGGHFLSDVIFSFFIMYGTAYFLYKVMFPKENEVLKS